MQPESWKIGRQSIVPMPEDEQDADPRGILYIYEQPRPTATYCISLDPKADEYVSNIFGRQYTVIDNIQRLPEKLPELFLALTK